MRRLVVASALLATLLIGPAGASTAIAAGPTDTQRATSAVEFLYAAQKPDGSIDGSIAETADFVIAAADLSYDPATLSSCSGAGALEYLATASDKATNDAGKTAKAILAIRAAGADPAAFHGRNLVARLDALYHAATGAYGDGSTFAQSFAVLALGSGAPAKAVDHLAALQDTDGSWNFKSAANATDGDTNSTAIALISLASAGRHTADAKAFTWLHTQQLADAGFPYQNSSTFGPPTSDPDSDSLVIQALLATGQDPTAAAWSKGGANPLTHLRSAQASNGGFTFPGNPKPDAFTTSQVVPGLIGKPYGSATSVAAGRSIARVAACPTTAPSGRVTAPPTDTVSRASGAQPLPEVPVALAGLAGLIAVAARRHARRIGR